MNPTIEERNRRSEVMRALLQAIDLSQTIKLPDFDPKNSVSGVVALQHVGFEPNRYSGSYGNLHYQFEGEEDLLHLIVSHCEGLPVSPLEAQLVATFLLEGIPEGLFWFKPGQYTQHFYIGHDVLPEYFSPDGEPKVSS